MSMDKIMSFACLPSGSRHEESIDIFIVSTRLAVVQGRKEEDQE
jgi:hypothetical protein